MARAGARSGAKRAPVPQGGDHQSGLVEAHNDTIFALLEATPDLAIEELRQALADKGMTSRLRHDPPLLRPPRHHAQKKTAHATEQDRARHPDAARGLVRRPT